MDNCFKSDRLTDRPTRLDPTGLATADPLRRLLQYLLLWYETLSLRYSRIERPKGSDLQQQQLQSCPQPLQMLQRLPQLQTM